MFVYEYFVCISWHRWVRQLQEACAGSLDGMDVTVTPDQLPNLLNLLNAGSSTFASMREQALGALDVMPATFSTMPEGSGAE